MCLLMVLDIHKQLSCIGLDPFPTGRQRSLTCEELCWLRSTDLPDSHCRDRCHGQGPRDVPTQTQDVALIRRQCFHYLASRRLPPRELPPAPEWTESLHTIHNGKGAGRQDCLPGRPDREPRNSNTDFCFLQEATHRQIPRLQLPPPRQGAPRSGAVFEGQSWEGVWRRKTMAGDPAPQTSVQSQRLPWTYSEEQTER